MKVDEWIESLCHSLSRAAEVFSQPALTDTGEGHQVYMRLLEALPPQLQTPVKRYIRKYCRDRGYLMKELAFKRGYLQFQIQPAPDPSTRRPDPRRTP